jgi:hypothetical protein
MSITPKPEAPMNNPTTPAQIAERMSEAQREFVLRMQPNRETQDITPADWGAITPCVPSGLDYPDVIWFGGMRNNLGKTPDQDEITFMFNETGLAVRDHLLSEQSK